MIELLITLVYVVFVLLAVTLVAVVLLQQGTGGGLGDALGGHAQATFGAGARGVNRLTAAVAAGFLVSALAIHVLNRLAQTASVVGLE